jgi:hypothetical protein
MNMSNEKIVPQIVVQILLHGQAASPSRISIPCHSVIETTG